MKRFFLLIPLTMMANNVVKDSLPSVVNIYLDEQDNKHHTLGSGVIIDSKNGYIITNSHVLRHGGNIIVTLKNKNYYKAKIIGSDVDSDIAVIQIDAPKLAALEISYRPVHIGDKIYTIGNPYGLSNTVTSGIISAKGRKIGLERYENFLQLDAPINPGNSGGALIDSEGKLIGINTAVFSNSGSNIGLGFAIPAFIFGPISKQLIEFGNMKRSLLGVYVQNLTPRLAKALKTKTVNGVLVSKVIPNSNADKIGIKPLDLILKVGQNETNSFLDLNSNIGIIRTNQNIEIQILRNGKIYKLNGKLLDTKPKENFSALAGVSLSSISYWSSEDSIVNGLRIVKIEKNSKAWVAGLRENDIIVNINREKINNISSLEKYKKFKTLLVTTKRDGIDKFMVIE